MIEITAEQLQENLAEALQTCAVEGERFIIVHEGREIAALVTPDDLDSLEELDELALDVEKHQEIKRALEEMLGIEDSEEEEEDSNTPS